MPSTSPTSATPDRITLLAVAFAAGTAAGCEFADHATRLLNIAAGITGALLMLAAAILAYQRPSKAFALVIIAACPIGAAHAITRVSREPDPRIHQLAGSELTQAIMTLRGRTTSTPRRLIRTHDQLAPLWRRETTWITTLDVSDFVTDTGALHPARGRWTLVITQQPDDPVPNIRPGSIIHATGRAIPPRVALHPGERDPSPFRRSAGRAGSLSVPHVSLIETQSEAPHRRPNIRAVRSRISDSAHRSLMRGLGDPATDAGPALCAALLMGRYEAGGADTVDAMRRIGLAHLLAISGLHVGLITGGTVLILRRLFRPTRLDGAFLLIVTALYLLIVEWRIPVLRATVMSAAIAVGMVTSRRWRIRGLLSMSAILLLVHRPEQITTAGFQLSFGVVLALLHLVQPMLERLHPLERPARGSLRGMLFSAFAVSTVAWLIAMPITAWHFGVIAPLSIPLAIIGLPIIAFMLMTGFLKMFTGALAGTFRDPLSEGLDTLAAALLRTLSEAVAASAHRIDALPGSSIVCDPPHGLLVAIMILWAAARLLGRMPLSHVKTRFIDLLLIGILVVPARVSTAPLRIDTIAVGDGSCYVVRDGGQTLIFDAGSASISDAGRSRVVPVLRALGVRSIDMLFISHADLDHFSAVPEIMRAFPVRRVLLTRDFCLRARAKGGPSAKLLRHLEAHPIAVELVDDTWSRSFGRTTLRVRYPAADDTFLTDNDASIVLHVTSPAGSILFTGDIEDAAITRLLAREPDLRADVLEFPHHGSNQRRSADLIEAVRPDIILQSTGMRRLRNDPWAGRLPESSIRLITARDGSIATELHDDGTIHFRTFRRSPY